LFVVFLIFTKQTITELQTINYCKKFSSQNFAYRKRLQNYRLCTFIIDCMCIIDTVMY